MILNVNDNVIPELADLWEKGFGDTREYIDLFLKQYAKSSLVFTDGEPGNIKCAAYLIPCKIIGLDKPAYYGYAATVLPSERRNGIFKRILSEMFEYMDKTKSALVQVPAEGLFDYYYKVGFTDFCKRKKFVFDEATSNCIELEVLTVSGDEYCRLRNDCFNSKGCVQWSKEYVDYALDEIKFCKDICCKLVYSGETYVIHASKKESVLTIHESTVPIEKLKLFTGVLMEYFNAEKIISYYPENPCGDGAVENYALGYGVDYLPSAWLGLSML